jgi:ABC-type multidrug transport system fused ATPase/permease subunit
LIVHALVSFAVQGLGRTNMSRQRGVVMRGLRIIGSYIRMHPWPFAISVTGATLYAAMTVGTTFVLGRITDDVLVPAFDTGVATSTVVWAVVAVMAVALLRALGIVTRRYFAGMTASRTMASLRSRVVDKYQQLPLAYHRSQPTGELLAHAEADVMAATEVLHPLPYTIAVLLLIGFAVIALIVTDPFLAVLGLLILPTLTLLNRYYTRRVEGPAQRVQQRMGDVSAVAHESIDGALVVKTLGRQRPEVERLSGRADALRGERIAVGRLRASFEPAFEAIPLLGMVTLIAVGSWRVSTGDMTVGTVVQFVALFQLLAFPMRLIGFILSDIPRAVAGFDRVQEVLDEPMTLASPTDTRPLPAGPLGLSLRDASFGYSDTRVLDDVSFDVAPNESVAIVGPTGSGKSTLATLMVRLADPDQGSVRMGGLDLRHVDTEELRRTASLVFQESFLFATTVRENLTLGNEIGDDEMVRAARLARAHQFVMSLPKGYDTVLGERGVTLSGGQRQRLAIARALVRNPRVLILDDATSAVDPTVEAEILAGLREELQTTLIVVAYRVSTISLADRVLFLDGGRIVASGSHHELLMTHPDYESMVRAYERGAA